LQSKYKFSTNFRFIGGFANPLLFKARIARVSSLMFRLFQSAIIKGRYLLRLMQKLVGRFVSRFLQI